MKQTTNMAPKADYLKTDPPAKNERPRGVPTKRARNRVVLNQLTRSPKQKQVEEKILELLSGYPRRVAERIFADDVLQYLQEYANSVSIKRLGMNDHGPVHMRIAALNAIAIFKLLVDGGVEPSLVRENFGTRADSLVGTLLGTFLHDLGMSIGRENHEMMSVVLVQKHLDRILPEFYPDPKREVIMRSLVTECIAGHMAHQRIASIEAGIVLVADGCDMVGGRARIPMKIAKDAHVGDIHRYSAASITDVQIAAGSERPVAITVKMSETAGFFQVENVLIPKLNASPIKQYVELYAHCTRMPLLRYL